MTKRTTLLFLVLFCNSAFAQSDLVINEFLASNLNWNKDENDDYDDWIEIYNPTGQAVNLGGYYITDTFNNLAKWQIPTGFADSTTIPAGGYLVLWADGEPEKGLLHLDFKLSKSGEELALVDQDGTSIIDSVSFKDQTTNISMGRYPTNWMYYDEPTPGQPNPRGFLGIAAPPTFSENAGVFTGNKTISFYKTDPNTVIRYTLDASDPTEASTLYSGPITIDTSVVIRARAFKEGYIPSTIVSNSYILNTTLNLPLLSVVTDPENLWNDTTGIYVNYKKRGMEWEREVQNQYVRDDELRFSIKSGIRIQGSTSRVMDKKSFRLFFREGYEEDRLEYDMFGDQKVRSFKNLVLRAGYDEDLTTSNGTLLRDPLVSELWKRLGHLTSKGNFAILRLNNDYWGIYNIRESINEFFVQDHLDYEDFDLIRYVKYGYELQYGTMENWQELQDFFSNNDFSQQSVYEEAQRRIDINNFTDLQALVHATEYFSWGYGAFAIKEQSPEAKWHWTVWDMDRAYTNVYRNEFSTYRNTTDFYVFNLIINRLLQNDTYRRFFINRLADLLNTTFRPENVVPLIDSLAAVVEEEIPVEADRWNSTVSKWYTNIQGLRSFASERPSVVRGQMVNYFTLAGQHDLIVDVSARRGMVKINTITITTFPWTGTYFGGMPITVEAIPFPGYRFAGWSDPNLPDSSLITVDLQGDLSFTTLFESEEAGDRFEIIAPTRVRGGERIPLIVRVKSNNDRINTDITREVILDAQGALTDTVVKIKKGVGTLNPEVQAASMFELRVDDYQFPSETRTIAVADSFPTQTYSGTLTTGAHSWDSVYDRHITADLTIPENSRLVIQPGTRVLLDNRVNVFVNGEFEVNGTKEEPVLFLSESPDEPWGGFEFYGTTVNLKYSILVNGGGDSTKAWKHCAEFGVQPMLFAKDSTDLTLDNTFIVFSPNGKAIGSWYSQVYADECVISNVFHGGEFWYTLLHYTNSHTINIPSDDRIYYQDEDNDGMHIDCEHPGPEKLSIIENCCFVSGKDDAIDHQNAFLEVKNCWLEDWIHEGVAASNEGAPITERNTVYLFNVIAKRCYRGFEAGHGSPHLIIDHCVAIENNEGIRFGDSYSKPSEGQIIVTNSIIYNNNDNINNYEPQIDGPVEGAIDVTYSMTNDTEYDSNPGCITGIPMFDADYYLLPESPGAGMGMHGSNMGLIDSLVLQTGPVVINEIMYNPSNALDSRDWIEIYNPQRVAQDIAGWLLQDNQDVHTFYLPPETVVLPNGYAVICRDTAAFKQVYPEVSEVVGEFDFGFGQGDQVRLYATTGQLVDSVEYDVTAPWPTSPNGGGPSLELVDFTTDNSVAENWMASGVTGGTPGGVNSIVTDIQNHHTNTPSSFALRQNYPNPFNSTTTIEYVLPERSKVTLAVYNVLGQQVAALVNNQWQEAGIHKLYLDVSHMGSGVYFYRLVAYTKKGVSKSFSKKALYLK